MEHNQNFALQFVTIAPVWVLTNGTPILSMACLATEWAEASIYWRRLHAYGFSNEREVRISPRDLANASMSKCVLL
jgi:hypothetical protein